MLPMLERYDPNEPGRCVKKVGDVRNPPSESYNYEENFGRAAYSYPPDKLIKKC